MEKGGGEGREEGEEEAKQTRVIAEYQTRHFGGRSNVGFEGTS